MLLQVDQQMALSDACLRTAGERLSYLRQRAGFTLVQAAQETGLSRSELSRLENGTRRLKDHHLEALAKLYGFAVEALRGVLAHDPDAAAQEDGQLLPCYNAASLAGKGIARAPSTLTRLPVQVKLGKDAYMIAVDGDAGLPVPARSLVVIDPSARSVLGDLVANIADWSPPLIILRRDAQGDLVEGAGGPAVHEFPKAVAVFSASHFAVKAAE
jgi:transcriptional regulator with XRE-family HTH domain